MVWLPDEAVVRTGTPFINILLALITFALTELKKLCATFKVFPIVALQDTNKLLAVLISFIKVPVPFTNKLFVTEEIEVRV